MTEVAAVRDYLAGWNARDMAAIHATFAEGGTYEDPSTSGPIRGEALTAYVAGLWAAFPDLAFETESIMETGPDLAAAQWVMTGTNSGSMMGLPPTGRVIRLRGADFFTLENGKLRSVTGYFDSAGVPRQLGLDVIVQPSAIGPFRFGVATAVQTGRTDEPGAFAVTCLEALDAKAVARVREGSRASLIDMLEMEGFIGATTATIGTRMITVSAWDDPESPRRVMAEGAHVQAMRGMYDGSLSKGGYTSVWIKHRVNPVFVRCDSCGEMTRGAGRGQECRCGAALPDPQPYW